MKTITLLALVLVAGAAGAQPPGGGGLTFEGLDADKSGALSQDEVAKFFAGRPAGPNGPPNAAEIFGRWDGNKDGSVSKAEFDARPRPPGGGGGGGAGGGPPPGGQPPG